MKTAFELYAELIDAIEVAGLTVSEVFAEAGYSASQRTRWNRGEHEPRLSALHCLAAAAKTVATRRGVPLGSIPTVDSLL